jgi:formylglycine-generating enzyme required for sulfatase activity
MAPKVAERFPDAEALTRELERLAGLPDIGESRDADTGPISGSEVRTMETSELSLEFAPDKPASAWRRVNLHWPIVVGLCGCLLMLVLIANFSRRETAPNEPTDPESGRPGMVWIPPGNVWIGHDPVVLRSFLLSLDLAALRGNPGELEKLVQANASPVRSYVPGFWIDEYEVTNAEYARFVDEMDYAPPKTWGGRKPPVGEDQHPVAGIRHSDALAHAAWARKKLPTDAQWIRAYRGDTETLFPWGNTWEPHRANVAENNAFLRSSPVAATPDDVSSFGVRNLVGNVDEMMRELKNRENRIFIVTRGSHWNAEGSIYGLACWPFYYGPADAVPSDKTGFRCVVETP